MPTTARGRRTRQLIIERTSAVFDQRGFAAATLNHLVESTGLTRGAFYFHFESKEALAQAIALAQADRWPQLLEEVEALESEPLRRLLLFSHRAGAAFQDDLVMRAASRLMSERAVIERELPQSYPFWADTFRRCLLQAAAEGKLADLSALVEPDWPTAPTDQPDAPPWVLWYADHLMATGLGLAQAVTLNPQSDLPNRIRAHWRLFIHTVCAESVYRDDLLGYVEALAQQTVAGSVPSPKPGSP